MMKSKSVLNLAVFAAILVVVSNSNAEGSRKNRTAEGSVSQIRQPSEPQERDSSRRYLGGSSQESNSRFQCLNAVRSEVMQEIQKVMGACRQSQGDQAGCQTALAEFQVVRSTIMDKIMACFNGGSSMTPVPPAPSPQPTPNPAPAPNPSPAPAPSPMPTPTPPAARCILGGKSIASGQSIKAYQAASVPAGSSCVSEMRVCDNGVLSGSYSNLSCSVQAPAPAPAPTPAPMPTPQPSIDGAKLYETNCSVCHGTLANSRIRGVSASTITSRISSVGAMKNNPTIQKLTPEEISAIAQALK